MKKFIFIPVVNNFDLLEKAVRSVKLNLFDEYIIQIPHLGCLPQKDHIHLLKLKIT